MTKQSPAPDSLPWLTVGVQALDSQIGRRGVVQLLADELGAIRTEEIEHPTRALLRPSARGAGAAWWAAVDNLRRAET